MSSGVKKYLELNSTYRDRINFPNPADFQVDISQRGDKSQPNALDPISTSYPLNIFSGSAFNLYTSPHYSGYAICNYSVPSIQANATYPVNILNSTTPNDMIISCMTGTLQTVLNYYRGCSIVANGWTISGQVRQILNFTYLNTLPVSMSTTLDFFRITLSMPFDNLITNQQFFIYNASDFSDPTNIYLFIPNGRPIDNYLVGYSVYNYIQLEGRKIISYDGNTGLAKLESKLGMFTWSTLDTFSVIKTNNIQANILVSTPTPEPGTLAFKFQLDETYINSFISVVGGTPDMLGVISQLSDINQIIGIKTVEINKVPTFTNIAYLKNSSYIQPPPLSYPLKTFLGPVSYLYPYSSDNCSPFVYTGSILSNSQPVIYDITLHSLTIPNQPLTTGGTITSYPYVYVEFENVCTTSSGVKNIIYSNNPKAYKAVFRVEVQELSFPKTELFTKNKGVDMTQKMVFKQNDSVRITIRLPNGDVFLMMEQDNVMGSIPDPFLQISALFAIEKI